MTGDQAGRLSWKAKANKQENVTLMMADHQQFMAVLKNFASFHNS